MTSLLVYAYAFSLPLTAFSIFPWFGFQLSYAIIFVLGLLLALNTFLSGRISIPNTPVNRAIIVFWAASLFSIIGIMTADAYAEFQGGTPLSKFFRQVLALSFMIVMYFILVTSIKNKFILLTAIKIFIFSTFLSAVYGFYQLIGVFLNLPYRRLLFNNPSFHLAKEDHMFMGLPRITSFSPEPSMFANALLAVIPLMIICYRDKVKLFSSSVLNSFFLMTILIAMILTFSRGGYLIVLIILLTIFFIKINFKTSSRLFLFVMLFLMIGMMFSQFLSVNIIDLTMERLFLMGDFDDLSIWERLTTLATAGYIFMDHPFFGVGLGNFGLNAFNYFPPWGYWEGEATLPAVNNLIARIAAELGIVGLAAFVYLIWTVTKEGIISIKQNRGENLWYSVSTGILLSFLAVFLHLSIGLATLSFSYFWFLIAAIVILNKMKEETRIV
jgi:O-antigen ligase